MSNFLLLMIVTLHSAISEKTTKIDSIFWQDRLKKVVSANTVMHTAISTQYMTPTTYMYT